MMDLSKMQEASEDQLEEMKLAYCGYGNNGSENLKRLKFLLEDMCDYLKVEQSFGEKALKIIIENKKPVILIKPDNLTASAGLFLSLDGLKTIKEISETFGVHEKKLIKTVKEINNV